jgi:thioredoxin-like negative regulator of GroEL
MLCLVVGCALAMLLATGCMDEGVSRVADVSPMRFNQFVLQSQQPVLVNFYKPG